MTTRYRIVLTMTAVIMSIGTSPAGEVAERQEQEKQMNRSKGLKEMVQSGTRLDEGLGGFPVLETGRIRLREVHPREDAAHWHSLLTDSQKADESVKQAEERLEGVRSRFYDRAYVIYWAITLKGKDQMIGNVRYWEWPGHPECPLQFGTIMYDLAGEYSKDKELAAEVLRAVAEFGLTQLNLVRVQCTVRPDDSVRSEALLAAGFQKEGVLRDWWLDQNSKEWQDEAMFSLVAADMKQPQAEQPPERD